MTTPRERSAWLTDMDEVLVVTGSTTADRAEAHPFRPTRVPGSIADVVALV